MDDPLDGRQLVGRLLGPVAQDHLLEGGVAVWRYLSGVVCVQHHSLDASHLFYVPQRVAHLLDEGLVVSPQRWAGVDHHDSREVLAHITLQRLAGLGRFGRRA